MTQAFTAPVSGVAQAAATRTARTSAGGSGPPGAGNEPAFSSVLDHHVARTAHAEGQNKTTGDSGGRRSSHGHPAGKGRHRGGSVGTQATTDHAAGATVRADAVPAAAPAVEAQPAPADTPTSAQTTVLSALATPAQSPASSTADTGQATGSGSAQASNFIPATIKPAPVAAATPGVATTAADQLSESGPEAAAALTDAAPQADAASVAAAASQSPAQRDAPALQAPQQTTAEQQQSTPVQEPTTSNPVPAGQDPLSGPDAGTAGQTPTSTPAAGSDAPATVASGQTSAPHATKPSVHAASGHSESQADAPAATAASAQPQATNAGTQDPGHNGPGGQPQQPPAQAAVHAPATDAQPQPQPATPAQAASATAQTPGIMAGPAPLTAPAAPTAATAAATGPARYGIGLNEAVETVQTTIELGARQGFSSAKIQLAPATLGQITIHLQKTSDGIVARVVAEHSAAAQTMQQGGDDLRRSLQNSGLHLLRLDIETRGDQRGSAGNSAHTSESGRTAGNTDAADTADDGASQPTTIVLPNGALVNVLA